MAGDLIFSKFCLDALSHILRHPRGIQTQDVVGIGWDGLVWVEVDEDGWGWGFRISWRGEPRCWERQFWPRSGFVCLPASFLLHFESLWVGHGSSWAQIGFRLGTMAPH